MMLVGEHFRCLKVSPPHTHKHCAQAQMINGLFVLECHSKVLKEIGEEPETSNRGRMRIRGEPVR